MSLTLQRVWPVFCLQDGDFGAIWSCSGVFRASFAMVGDVEKRSLLDWFEAVLSLSRWNLLEVRSKAQIYTLRVVIWMMLPQRLVPCGSQQQAVHRMAEGQVEQPADAVIEGRLIVVTRRGFRDSW